MTSVDINFEKKKIWKATGEFLLDRAIEKEDKDDIQRQGYKLQYKEANRLLRNLMQAILVGDGEDNNEKDTVVH